MSAKIRIHNDGAKDIRVVQVDNSDKPVLSYRIAAGQMGPTIDMEGPGLFGGHALIVSDDEHFVATDPTKLTDVEGLAEADTDEEEDTKA